MKYAPSRYAGFLFTVAILMFCAVFTARGQTNEETEVPVLNEVYSRNWECVQRENSVVSKEAFRQILADARCINLRKTLEVDFEKQTLISFSVRGDCFVSADSKIFRSDAEKKYTVKIRKRWGGCRAAGSFQRWFVIEKIPPDYKVEFDESKTEYTEQNEKDVFSLINSQETLETKQIDLKGCIQTIFITEFVIKDEADYLKTIRNDASRDFCLKNLEKIDFARHTLLGIQINSGYCRVPAGLEYKVVKDAEKKQYLPDISYIDPRGSTCRALSQYDLWLLVPKIPEGYDVKFQVKARQKSEK
ncbi:MAG: hypothetical protein WA584_00970 [Pyrinomonadaceae bacterium]